MIFNQTILDAFYKKHTSSPSYNAVGNIQVSSNPAFVEFYHQSGYAQVHAIENPSYTNIYSVSIVTDENYGIYITENDTPSIQIYRYDLFDTSRRSTSWAQAINCASTWPSVGNIKGVNDGIHHFSAISYPSQNHVLLVTLALHSGDSAGSLRTAQSSQQLTLGSLYVDSGSTAWLNMYSSSSSYSELTRFGAGGSDYTVYQQTGYSYGLQYVFPSNNDRWLGVGLSEHIVNTTLAWMGEASGLSVTTTTTSGLSDTSAYSLSARSTVGLLYFRNILGLDTSSVITITTSELTFVVFDVLRLESLLSSSFQSNVNVTVNNSNESNNENSDDGLSSVAIALIVVFSIIGTIWCYCCCFCCVFMCLSNRDD